MSEIKTKENTANPALPMDAAGFIKSRDIVSDIILKKIYHKPVIKVCNIETFSIVALSMTDEEEDDTDGGGRYARTYHSNLWSH